ncbi:MAG: hypothetical protein ACKO0U_02525 [Gammaproteobacteria bacterium]
MWPIEIWRARRERHEAARRAAEEERLLKLYWNRAELKRSVDDLEEEVKLLRDLLKQQQALVTRAEEDAVALEEVLASPEQGFGALLHFALRGLWRAGRLQVQQLAGELRRQEEERERRQFQASLQGERRTRLEEADARIAAAQELVVAERARVAAAERELLALTGLWHFFRRQEQRDEVRQARELEQAAAAALESMRSARATLLKTPVGDFPGLSIEARRRINLQLLALVQQLAAHLAVDGIGQQMRVAWQRDLSGIRYGGRAECLARLAQVNAVAGRLRMSAGSSPAVLEQAARLGTAAVYRSPADTTPAAATLESEAATLPGSSITASRLLADDYFEIRRFLLD